MAPTPTGTMRISTADASAFANERAGDLIMLTGSNAQRVLLGTDATGACNAMLSLSSNSANVAGTVNAEDISTNTITTTDIFLTTYDPRNNNTLQVVQPYYQADTFTINLATYASNAADYASNVAASTVADTAKISFASNAGAFGSNLKPALAAASNAGFSASNTVNAWAALSNGNQIGFKIPASLTGTTQVNGPIVPSLDAQYDLGAVGNSFRSLYVGGNTIYLGSNALSSDGFGSLTVDHRNSNVKAPRLKVAGVDVRVLHDRVGAAASQEAADRAVRTWTSRIVGGSGGASINCMCWSPELSCFVGVTWSAAIVTSRDGVNWIATDLVTDAYWSGICWSSQLRIFVAVSNEGYVVTSPDGDTWTNRTVPASNGWSRVAWSPELSLFVVTAYGGSGRLMTSPDGVNWTLRTLPGDSDTYYWNCVCWAAELGLFVAVAGITDAGTATNVMTSPDGITWTIRNSVANNRWSNIAWSPERSVLVAVAADGTGNRVMTSSDGVAWTAHPSTDDTNSWYGLTWAPELSLFVAVSNTGTQRMMTSPDGINWTARSLPLEELVGVCWSPQLSIFAANCVSGTVLVSDIGLPASKSTVLVSPAHLAVNQASGLVTASNLSTSNLITQGEYVVPGTAAFSAVDNVLSAPDDVLQWVQSSTKYLVPSPLSLGTDVATFTHNGHASIMTLGFADMSTDRSDAEFNVKIALKRSATNKVSYNTFTDWETKRYFVNHGDSFVLTHNAPNLSTTYYADTRLVVTTQALSTLNGL